MLPRRKLSEIENHAKLRHVVYNFIVEGISDKTIVDVVCRSESIPSIVYPANTVEFDNPNVSGGGGERGRIKRAVMDLRPTPVERLLFIIDRDGESFSDFYITDNCAMTDLSCLEIYPLELNEFREFLSRVFNDDVSHAELLSILDVSRIISIVRWVREEKNNGATIADPGKSLAIVSGLVSLDLPSWIQRSSSGGGGSEIWQEIQKISLSHPMLSLNDHRHAINIHVLDNIFRFWSQKVKNKKLNDYWIEDILRGLTSAEKLMQYEFFRSVVSRCKSQLSQRKGF